MYTIYTVSNCCKVIKIKASTFKNCINYDAVIIIIVNKFIVTFRLFFLFLLVFLVIDHRLLTSDWL